MRLHWALGALLFFSCGGATTEKNHFSFCRDFAESVCREALSQKAIYPLAQSRRNSTMRDFWNSVYFRGDRLAFVLRNAAGRRAVDFDCLYGHYHFDNKASEHFELEYLELKEKDVFGLVMLGSLLEKRFARLRDLPFKKPEPFTVTYSVFCRNDLLARSSISIELR